MYRVLLLRLCVEFSVGIERSQNLMLDQKLDQILIPYLFLVLSINFT